MATLTFLDGPYAGHRYALRDGDYIIGRRSDCRIFVPDMRVSRQHARIVKERDGWYVEDLGSNNGSYVNGQRIQRTLLRHEDEIMISGNRIRVELNVEEQKRRSSDSHVTVVDLLNPKIFHSTEDAGAALIGRTTLSGVATSEHHAQLLERKLSALQTILELAAATSDPAELLDKVCEQLLDVFERSDSLGVLVEDEASGELRVQSHKRRRRGYSDNIRVPGTIIQHVVQDRRGVLLGDSESRRTPTTGTKSISGNTRRDEPAGSRMGAPISARQMHYGVLYVECESGSFTQEDVDLLTSIAAHLGLALYTARMHRQLLQRERLERDLRVARQIQRSLLPAEPPDVIGLQFAIHYEPAYDIGGDFYDFVWHDESRLALVVGDVAGKAISAALYMARLTSELRSQAGVRRSPSRLLSSVNDEMAAIGQDGMFATLIYAIYDLERRSLLFTNAGHVAPLVRREGRVFALYSEAAHVAPVGVLPNMEIGEAQYELQPGDLLVLTTDGVIEARDPSGVEYGLERLSQRISTTEGGPEGVVKAILSDIDRHVGSGAQTDDITIVAMSVDRRPGRRRRETDAVFDPQLSSV